MKKLVLIFVFALAAISITAQEMRTKNTTSFDFGSGLNFSFNDGAYTFNISGMIQPSVRTLKIDDGSDTDYFFSAKRAFFSIGGKAFKEKVGFFVQNDYSLGAPLMDAWLSYDFSENFVMYAGQKLNFVNNRAMTTYETHMQFAERGLLSRTFSRTGREFGLFFDTSFQLGDSFVFSPKASLTSGDGRGSFGEDSRDTDLGGLKYGGRLDIYPLGSFKDGNELSTADLLREDSFKFVVGVAGSQNVGASEAVGEGHGSFQLYDADGKSKLPNYAQLYIDFLAKYQGLSVLFEYVNASASELDGIFTDDTGSTLIAPTEISEYLVLGDAYNIQLGYLTKSGFSFDARYESLSPEFETNANSVLSDASEFTIGLSKYFKGNSIKLQTMYSNTSFNALPNQNSFEVMFQITF